MPRIVKSSPEDEHNAMLRSYFGQDLDNPNIYGVPLDVTRKYYPELLKDINPTKSTQKKDSKTKSKVKKLLKEVKSTKIPKDKMSTELVSMIFDIVGSVVNEPKTKKFKTEDVEHQIKEVTKLLKAPKKTLKKLVEADKTHIKYHPSVQDYKEMKMDQKVYKKKVSNVEPHIANYVAIYKELLNKDNKGGARTRAINKHISNFMKDARPSDISTANALMREYKEGQPKVEAPTKVKKSTVPKNKESEKYKSVTTYVKKNKPSLKDDELIHLIVIDLINEDKRMSKKLLDKVLKDYEIIGSGLRKRIRKIKGGVVGDANDTNQSGDEGESDIEELIEDEYIDQPEPIDPDNEDESSKAEHERELSLIIDRTDDLTTTGITTSKNIKEFISNQKQNPESFIGAFDKVANKIGIDTTNKSNDTLERLREINALFGTDDEFNDVGADVLASLINSVNLLYKRMKKNKVARIFDEEKKYNKRKRDDQDPPGGHAYKPIFG